MNQTLSLTRLPVELVADIYCHLPSLTDAISLGASSKALRAVWINYANSISKVLGPRCIPSYKHARNFLALQNCLSSDSPLSAKDAIRMVRNADIVEAAIAYFESDVARKIRCQYCSSTFKYINLNYSRWRLSRRGWSTNIL